VEEVHVEIRDLDNLSTKDEVAASVHALTGHQMDSSNVKALRPAYAGTKMAVVGPAPQIAVKLLSERRVKVGWRVMNGHPNVGATSAWSLGI